MRDKEARLKALQRLAVATREKVETQTFALYLEDTATIDTRLFVEACRRLETRLTWFPKLKELIDECSAIVRYLESQEVVKRLPPPDMPSPEWEKEWVAKLKALVQAKRMPS